MLDIMNLTAEHLAFIGTVVGSAVAGFVISVKGYKSSGLEPKPTHVPMVNAAEIKSILVKMDHRDSELEIGQRELRDSVAHIRTEVQVIRALLEFIRKG